MLKLKRQIPFSAKLKNSPPKKPKNSEQLYFNTQQD